MTLKFRGALEALSFWPDLGGRNDFRNMINCPAVAFRRRRGFQTDYILVDIFLLLQVFAVCAPRDSGKLVSLDFHYFTLLKEENLKKKKNKKRSLDRPI